MKRDENMAKATKVNTPLIDGIENERIEKEIQTIVDNSVSELNFEDAMNRFAGSIGTAYVKARVKGAEEKLKYGLNSVKASDKTSRVFTSKPTTIISCVLRNTSTVEKNYCNVTDETYGKHIPKDQKIGIAGTWRKCKVDGKIWDTSDERYGDNCPTCGSVNTVILAEQAVPEGTIGIVNRQEMRSGNIATFNTKTVGIFLHTGDGYEAAYLKLTGSQRKLLDQVRFGVPFDINVAETPYINATTNEKWFSSTGTSKVSPCSVADFADILAIYEDHSGSTVASVDGADDGGFYAFFLQVVGEPSKPKDKWIVNLVDPDSESEEPEIVTMYIDDEAVAKQFLPNDTGIFETRYSESTRTIEGVSEKVRSINVNVESCGLPVYLFGENGTKLISA